MPTGIKGFQKGHPSFQTEEKEETTQTVDGGIVWEVDAGLSGFNNCRRKIIQNAKDKYNIKL